MKSFSVISEDFRLCVLNSNLIDEKRGVRDEQMVPIYLPQDIVYVICPILFAEKEQFKFKVRFYANVSPIPTVIKDYLAAEVYTCHSSNA